MNNAVWLLLGMSASTNAPATDLSTLPPTARVAVTLVSFCIWFVFVFALGALWVFFNRRGMR